MRLKETTKKQYTHPEIPNIHSGREAICCDPIDSGNQRLGEDYSFLESYTPGGHGPGGGSPFEFANIGKGQVVLDLGSGAGNDVLGARQIVGEKGMVIGLDKAEAMVDLANHHKAKLSYRNVHFISGSIETMPFQDNSVDVVISNCVISLVPDKGKAFAEIYRVLKPGGHFTISDIVAKEELPDEIQEAVELLTGCISGAVVKHEYLELIKKTGFKDLLVHKMKNVALTDNLLRRYLSTHELIRFRKSGNGIFSMTFSGYK